MVFFNHLNFVCLSLEVSGEAFLSVLRFSEAVFGLLQRKHTVRGLFLKVFLFLVGLGKLELCVGKRVLKFGYFDASHVLNDFVVALRNGVILGESQSHSGRGP